MGKVSVSVQVSKATETVDELGVKTWEGSEAFDRYMRTHFLWGKKTWKITNSFDQATNP